MRRERKESLHTHHARKKEMYEEVIHREPNYNKASLLVGSVVVTPTVN